jgi:hypothetical protein
MATGYECLFERLLDGSEEDEQENDDQDDHQDAATDVDVHPHLQARRRSSAL